MKKVSKTLAIVLCLAMILSLTALANWTEFGKTSAHNHVVSSSPTSTTPTIKQIALRNAGGGWDGIDTEPLMRTVGSGDDAVTYAYVFYDGHAANGRLAKVNCSATNPYVVWDRQVSGASGFQLSTPLLVPATSEANDVIYLAASYAEKVNGVAIDSDISISSNVAETITWDHLNISTTSNRLAIGILLGEYSTQQANFSAHGNAVLYLTNSNLTTTTITLDPSLSATGNNYHPFEQPVYDSAGNITSYQYWWYINHNITGDIGSDQTLTATITLTDHSGTAKSAEMFAQHAAVQKVTNLSATAAEDVVVNTIKDNITGQVNTPVTTDGTYIYFGTYTGYSTAGTYYQLNLTPTIVDDEEVYSYKTWTTSGYGFYWAGAANDGTRVYFGSDNGMLYWRSIAAFNTTGGNLNLKSTLVGGATDAGNVRSTIMIDSGKLYFTSQGGYLWCCSYNTSTNKLVIDWKTALRNVADSANVTCTSTPTKVGNRIYIGCYGGNGKSGIKCVDATTHTESYVIQDNSLVVQCSVVVNDTGTGTDYLYFVTNAAAGTGYCYSWAGSGTGTLVWNGISTGTVQTYALGGMSIENGIAVYGNDYNYLSIVK